MCFVLEDRFMKEINIIEYNHKWPFYFKTEAFIIKNALGDNCLEVHHIGSTSISGMIAKPIIDIVVSVDSKKDCIKSLELIGYKYKAEYNIPFRLYFNKAGFNVHLYERNNPEIELNIKFRDYLRDNSELVQEYNQLKKSLLQKSDSYQKNKSMFTGYNLGKDEFIKKILSLSGFDKIRFLKAAHIKEWKDYHRIRREQIFEASDLIYDENHFSINAENHFHFILCKGVDVITIAHVEFLNKEEAAIRFLATDDLYKCRGYASYIMKLLEKWIKQNGINIIKLHANPKAVSFYRKLGYEDMEFDDVCISDDIIDLGKIL